MAIQSQKTLNVNVWTTFRVVYLAIFLQYYSITTWKFSFLGEAIMAAFIVKEMQKNMMTTTTSSWYEILPIFFQKRSASKCTQLRLFPYERESIGVCAWGRFFIYKMKCILECILYVDLCFTIMQTPEGYMVSGWFHSYHPLAVLNQTPQYLLIHSHQLPIYHVPLVLQL